MSPLLKNVIAVVAALVLGSFINMGIIMLGSSVIPPPSGADVTTAEGLKKSMHLFEGKHFIMPFLAHALGTIAGAFIAAKFAANQNMKFAIAVGVLFLIGGIINVVILPSPMWFNILDLVVAYLPAAFLGGRLGTRNRSTDIN